MSEKRLIVDGYNVIHNLDRYRRLGQKDISLAVNSLVSDLSSLKGATGWQVSVVFDGREQSSEDVGGVEVIYAAKGRSADAVIERLSYADDKGEVMVATADYQQQKVIFRANARRLTPRELEELISESAIELKNSGSGRKKSFLEDRLPDEIRSKLDKLRRE